MPLYRYKALSRSGTTVAGEEAAESAEALASELRHRGLLIRDLTCRRPMGRQWFSTARVKPDELLLFCQEMTSLLGAGLTLTDTLSLLEDRPSQRVLQRVVSRLLHDIRGGAPFSTAVSHHPEVFDSLFVAALRTGERIGDLPGVLNRYQHDLKRRIALRRRVGQALAYPGFLLLTLTAVLGILFVFVLPRFVHMYADLGSELPWPTQLVVTLVENMPLLALTTLLIGGAMMGAYRAISRTAAGRARLEEWLYRAPVLGPVLQLSTQAQTARTLGTLIESGTTVVDALTAAQESSTSAAFAVRLDDARQEVANGGSLWRALLDSGVLPQSAAKMVEAGEASGNLHGALGGIAAYFEEKLEHSLARLMAVMEPALMLTMGVLVGGVIAVMYLPIFSMANVIQ